MGDTTIVSYCIWHFKNMNNERLSLEYNRPLLKIILDFLLCPLDYGGYTLTTADAHGEQAELNVLIFHTVDRRSQ